MKSMATIGVCMFLFAMLVATTWAQEILPFSPAPSGSTPGLTIQDSVYKKRVEPKHLAEGAPNVLVILMDDVEPGTPSTYDGEINTPTLDRGSKMGISFNRFHSTAMCSPTRAALLTGRNHTRVGISQIAAIANDFDGFSGTIPKSSATLAEVLKNYGYNIGAWGRWHNTPEEQITPKGPIDYWPTGYGFEYFYGFLAGEASQYDPTRARNTNAVTEHLPKGDGTISEPLAQNGIPTKISQYLKALDEIGGLDALGGPKTDNMYHAGWAWAGSRPYKSTKLVGAHFGGTRQPMAIAWPKRMKADPTARPQFHHVIDIVPIIYELTKITPPKVVNGFEQDSLDGVGMVYAFGDAKAPGNRKTPFIDIMASRGIYHDGWFASAPGPREPWIGGMPKGIKEWSPLTDKWELYNIDEDWSQANDLAASNPKKIV